jgi:hypothetical protein
MQLRLPMLLVCLLAARAADTPKQLWIDSFLLAWETVREQHYDARLGGVDWDGAKAELLPKVAAAENEAEARGHLEDLLRRLGHSHVGLIPREVYGKDAAAAANLPDWRAKASFDKRGDNIGHFKLNVFVDPEYLASAMESAIESCRECVGFIVDLRGNPGGLGGLAATLAGWFVERPCVLGTLIYRDMRLTLAVNPRVSLFQARLAILIDEKTASTAEMFAAGMKDLGRARVFGQRSAGAALPSMIVKLPSGDRLQYVIANYISIGGTAIEGHGVTPDVATMDSLGAAVDWILNSEKEKVMKLTRRILVFALGALSAFSQTATPAAPTAEAILDRYIEATGGKAAYGRLKSQVARGTIEFVGQGIKGTVETHALVRNNSLTVIDLTGIGKIQSGVTDGVVWQSSAIQGSRIAEGEEAQQMLRSSRLDSPVHWREIYEDFKVEGLEDLDGKAVYKVSFRAKGAADPQTNWYDKETGLLLRTQMVIASPMGKVPVLTKLSEYRDAGGGILQPARMEQKLGPQTMLTVFESAESNVEIPAEKFAFPPDIQKLLDKKKEEARPQSPPI